MANTHPVCKTVPTRQQLMDSDCTHFLVKDMLRMTERKDPVDAYYDVLTVAEVLKAELDRLQGRA